MDLIFTLLISPLSLIYEVLFEIIYRMVQSYGAALLLLSVVTSILVIPLDGLVKGAISKEKKIQGIINPQLDKIKREYTGSEKDRAIERLYHRYSYNPVLSYRLALGVLVQLPLLLGAYWMISEFPGIRGASFWFLRDLSEPDGLLFGLNVLPLLMTIINLLIVAVTPNMQRKECIQAGVIAFVFLVLLYSAPSALLLYWTTNNIISLFKALARRLKVGEKIGSDYGWFKLGDFIKRIELENCIPVLMAKQIKPMYCSAVFLICVAVFLYFPLSLYVSDPSLINGSFWEIIVRQVVYFEAASIIAFLTWRMIRRWDVLSAIVAILLMTCAVSGLVFSFVLSPDYGIIDGLRFQNEDPLFSKWLRVYDVSLLVATLILVILFFVKRVELFNKLCVFGACGLLVVSAWGCVGIGRSLKNEVVNIMSSESEVPSDVKEMLTFSKEGKNVVIVMLDMFTGGHIKNIVDQNPDFKIDLDGFVWYSDTVAGGATTLYGKPGILGGEEATPIVVNAKSGDSLEEKIANSWCDFLRYFDSKNMPITISDYLWLKPELMSSCLNNSANYITSRPTWSGFTNFWLRSEGLGRPSKKVNVNAFLTAFGLFEMTPLSARKNIYRSGKWLGVIDQPAADMEHTIKWYSEIDSYHRLSTLDNRRGSFKFITNLVTHFPWQLNDECKPCAQELVFKQDSVSQLGIEVSHFQAEICALKSLIKWINWMKAAGIYDNTMLVFVSDHGESDSAQFKGNWLGGRAQALLLVKNFNSRGPLEENKTALMANWDVPALVSDAFGIKVKKPWLSQKRERYTVSGSWQRERMDKDAYVLDVIWKIKGSMYEKSNWTQIK